MNTLQAIGALTAKIDSMNERLDRDREDRKEHDAYADQARKEVKQSLSELKAGHDDILKRVNKMEPVTDMVTSWKAKVAGGVAVLGLIGGILIGGATFFKEQIAALLWG